jgi:hypothetical protein
MLFVVFTNKNIHFYVIKKNMIITYKDMICYNEKQIIFGVIATVIATIVAYCVFIKPGSHVNYENVYINNKQSEGFAIGGHLSSHSGTISAAPYYKSSIDGAGIPYQSGLYNHNFKFQY